MSKKAWITAGAVAGVLVLGGVGATIWGVIQSRESDRPAATIRTAVVERRSLASGLEIRGSLAYGESQELAGADGIVTKVPGPGSTHKAGEPLLEIEGNPVFLLEGSIPLWRDMSVGLSGVDVDTLRAALTSLGYAAGSTSPAVPYDEALAGAVDKLYADAGYPAPSTRPAAIANRAEAAKELDAAREQLASAQQSLRTARQGPSQKDLTDARNAVAAAQRALTVAQQCTAQDRQDNPEAGGLCDVAAARENLASAQAGLSDLQKTPDTSAESAAVTAAQSALTAAEAKASQTSLSTVGPKDILLIPTQEMRVDQVMAKIGQTAAGPVVTWTSTRLSASVDLTDAQKKLIVAGAEVEVTLPDGTILAGIVGDVSAAREDPQTYEYIPPRARIDIEDQARLAENGVSGVTIRLIQDEASDTLVVPVTALLALSEGGYAVELASGGLVGVDIGLIQDTLVQVIPTAGDLKEGDEVVIA
ncbi:MAG: hypothetical protein LBJ62_07680 [Bifidobacteriaceae bacterium]|jgi:hypothetical protein|nr:hypothetical protein [Bifidobacteriaceae bacterium]